MVKKCLGCGIELQNTDKNKLGYIVDLNQNYCQRCFRMTHYNDHRIKDFIPDNQQILNDLEALNGHYIWVIDIFNLDSSLESSLAQFYQNHECSIILNKCDLLPSAINYEHLGEYVLKRIRKLGIQSKAIITRGVNDDFLEVFDRLIGNSLPLIITGVANVGKSTIINQLLGQQLVTTNPYPATTMRINEIVGEKYHIYDSAGLWQDNSLEGYISLQDLKTVVPMKQIRPTVFQLRESQSLALGGLARIDLTGDEQISAVVYCSNQLTVHRSKQSNADKLWQNNYGKDLKPTALETEYPQNFKHLTFNHKGKADYYISGLGFVCVTSSRCNIDIYVPYRVQVSKREAMI